MNIDVWTEEETKYCIAKLSDWRKGTFKQQEELISQLKAEGILPQSEAQIRLRFNYLDRLTNGNFNSYELLTIPEADKKYIGACKA